MEILELSTFILRKLVPSYYWITFVITNYHFFPTLDDLILEGHCHGSPIIIPCNIASIAGKQSTYSAFIY